MSLTHGQNIYLFIVYLTTFFNSSDFIVLIERRIVNNELKQKKGLRRNYPGICLERQRKTTKTLSG